MSCLDNKNYFVMCNYKYIFEYLGVSAYISSQTRNQ